ncbi:hypothetical protein AADZ86_16140 [Colwelliaceae bacterium BS250]
MKKIVLILALFSLSCVASEDTQGKKYSFGIGIGSAYSGIGGNFGIVSKNDMKYISAGCVDSSSMYGTTCGVGAGWIKTDLFDLESNKHGVGVYVSIVGHESYATFENEVYSSQDDDIYGVGISYTYFMNGINESGTIFGISTHITNADHEDSYGGFLQVGYQF